MILPFATVSSLSALYNCDRTDDFIESGQFGTVYRAISLTDRGGITKGTAVAVKELAKNKITTDKEIGDVVNEVEVMKRLAHRNCIRFVEAFQTNAFVYIVMELIDNAKDLFAVMREPRSAGAREEWSRKVIAQLLDALAYLHRNLRVVHRDVKPENILITNDDCGIRAVLIDYGFAKFLGNPARPVLTPAMLRQKSLEALSSLSGTSGPRGSSVSLDALDDVRSTSPMLSTPCGTLKYLAPETVRGLSEFGSLPMETTRGDLPQRDVYAAGLILFSMLSQTYPFSGSTRGELIRQMEEGPKFDARGWEGITEEAKAFVSGLMSAVPGERLTAHQALLHPWLKGFYGIGQEPIHEHKFENMAALPRPCGHSARESSTNKYFSFIGKEHVPVDQS